MSKQTKIKQIKKRSYIITTLYTDMSLCNLKVTVRVLTHLTRCQIEHHDLILTHFFHIIILIIFHSKRGLDRFGSSITTVLLRCTSSSTTDSTLLTSSKSIDENRIRRREPKYNIWMMGCV
jgi:hypothetical protein